MGSRDPRVDIYIEFAAPFAQPILKHFRDIVHSVSKEIDETIKWGFPHFMHQGILCSMAAFKAHCAIGFWKHGLVVDEPRPVAKSGMGQFGKLLTVKDLPTRQELKRYIREAIRINAAGIKDERIPSLSVRSARITLPAPFRAALNKNKKALAAFKDFSPTNKKEYITWIREAKREETRERRIRTAIEWIAEGKPRNWKYMD
jgi:uncharacterized protein YdeI (YjbR/CyaY-like superfamily)